MRVLLIIFVAVLLDAALPGGDVSQSISSEALRVVAPRALFPGLAISLDRGKRIDNSWTDKAGQGNLFFPDALAAENVYSVTGKAMNKVESQASEDIATEKFSSTRQVRLRIFPWPKENDPGLLAVVQYDFPGASPAMSCPSIGLAAHIVRKAANWTVKDRRLFEPVHHHSLQEIRLLDLTGRGADRLVVESDFGGAGADERLSTSIGHEPAMASDSVS